MSMKEWLTRMAGKLQRNMPSILTGSGIFHMLLGTGLAVKATPEAMRKIEEKKEEEGHERLTFSQTMQAVWRCYIWAALAEGVGIGCVIGGQVESNKRQAALTMLVNSAEIGAREFQEYRRYVRERLGEQKEAEIHNQAVQTVVDQNPPPAAMMNQDIVDGVAPKPICFHESFGRYFYVDYDTVAAAVNRLNMTITTSLEGYVSLNDFYREIDVSTIEFGDLVGWSIETGMIEIPDKKNLDYAGTPSGIPCWVLEFTNPPQYEYKYFRKH
jgi:hypothetical protein